MIKGTVGWLYSLAGNEAGWQDKKLSIYSPSRYTPNRPLAVVILAGTETYSHQFLGIQIIFAPFPDSQPKDLEFSALSHF